MVSRSTLQLRLREKSVAAMPVRASAARAVMSRPCIALMVSLASSAFSCSSTTFG